jgi:hypothetical protein
MRGVCLFNRGWSTVGASLASLFILAAPATSAAERAEYVEADALPSDGLRHVLDVALFGQYARVVEPDRLSGLTNLGDFGLRTRAALGKNPTYCLGLDGEIGGSNRGVVYGAVAYPVGVGGRWGQGNTVSLCGGAGFDAVGDAVPLAARFPAELAIGFALGPIRPTLWLRPSWIAGPESRRQSSISFLGELEAGLWVRLSPEHRYWTTTNAGGGIALGVAYREFMDTRYVAAMLGFDFVGAR